MERTGTSSGWKIAILGGCAVVALCGATCFGAYLITWLSPSTAPPVNPYPQPLNESVPQQNPVLAVNDVLAGHRWIVRSPTLLGSILEADFRPDGSFEGMLTVPPGEILFQSQWVNGAWNIADPLLYLDWVWVWTDLGPQHEQIPIQITSISQLNVQGVDESLNLWQFERID